MRKILLVIGVIIAVAIGVSLSTLRTHVDRGARKFAAELADASGSDVTLGDFSFAVFPPAVTVNDVKVSKRVASIGDFTIVEVPQIHVAPRLLPLLTGRATIDVIDVHKPVLRIHRSPNETTTFLSDAMLQAMVDSPVDVRVHGGVVELIDDINDAGLRLHATEIDADVTTDGEAIFVEAEGSALGDESSGRVKVRLAPGVGPTGGHAMELEASFSDAAPEAAKMLFPMLANVDLRGPVEVALEGDGFLGETATEAVPAEDWDGRFAVTAAVGIAGQVREMQFDGAAAVDDKRYQVKSGRGQWGEFGFEGSGWVSRTGNGKVAARLIFDTLAGEKIAETFDAPEGWRPQADVALTMRMMGTVVEPLFRYEARAEELKFEPWAGVQVSAAPVQARGSMLAVNAEINGSLDCENLKIGAVVLDQALIGISYWREKLTINSTKNQIWQGTADGGIAYWPHADGMVEGGGMIANVNADDAFAALFSDVDGRLEGSLDAMLQVRRDVNGDRLIGQVAVHSGKLGRRNYIVDALRSAFEGNDSLVPWLVQEFPLTLGEPAVAFDKLSFDAQLRDEGYSLHAIRVAMIDAELVMDATVDDDDHAKAWGTLILSSAMSAEIVGRVAGASVLVGSDGRLRIPVDAEGDADTAMLRADPEFAAALVSAARGVAVAPFATIESDTSAFSELPDMYEYFGR